MGTHAQLLERNGLYARLYRAGGDWETPTGVRLERLG
jgi:hypothetical protein